MIILDVWMNVARCLGHLFWFFTKCHVNVNVFIYCCLNLGAWKIDHSCKHILFREYMFKVSPSIIEEQIYASYYCCFSFFANVWYEDLFSKIFMKHRYLRSQERFNINWWHFFRKLSKQWKTTENCLQTKNTIDMQQINFFKKFVLNS